MYAIARSDTDAKPQQALVVAPISTETINEPLDAVIDTRRVEPRDWMPGLPSWCARSSQHAHSEIVGMREGNWISRAPQPEAKRRYEFGTKQVKHIYSAAETLGTSRDQMQATPAQQARQVHPANWALTGVIGAGR
jgi:1,2-phenylacetyl-CoA epoxidase catalytic subunit